MLTVTKAFVDLQIQKSVQATLLSVARVVNNTACQRGVLNIYTHLSEHIQTSTGLGAVLVQFMTSFSRKKNNSLIIVAI